MVSDSQKVVFTNGCFYLLHPGHIQLFKQIKQLFPTHRLVVGINSQKSIEINKPTRKQELFSDEDRMFMISSITYVDEVHLFDDETPINLINKIRPDVIVKGGDYLGKSIVGAEYANVVAIINISKHYSTTNTLLSTNSLDCT